MNIKMIIKKKYNNENINTINLSKLSEDKENTIKEIKINENDIENLILEEFTDKKESNIFKIINNFLINYKFIILFLIIILLYLKRYYIL
jgi:hypothetical protein